MHSRGDVEMTDQKRSELKKTLIYSALAILVAVLAAGAYLWYVFGTMNTEKISTKDKDLGISEEIPQEKKSIQNLVFYGVDSTDNSKGRSDAIMVVTIDTFNNKIKLSSIPRDSYVNIPGRGMDKITHAYSYGGPALAIKTLNSNFNLDVRYFVTVDFDSLPKIIDSMGGVEITVTDEEARIIRYLDGAGTYNLSGHQALIFSRIRKIDSDFERGRRQRDVMQALIKKALHTSSIRYPAMLSAIMPELTTNMTAGQMLKLASLVSKNDMENIEQMRFPQEDQGYGKTINGIYYYVFDIAETKNRVLEYIYYDIKPPEVINEQTTN